MSSLSLTGRGQRLVAVFVAAVTLVGCEGVVDDARLEQVITDEVERQTGLVLSEVQCPENRPLQAGDTFTCDATGEDGRTLEITVTQQDDQGNVRWEVTGETLASPSP